MFRWSCACSVVMCAMAAAACGGSSLEPLPDAPVINPFYVFTEYEGLASLTVTDVAVDYIRGGAWFTTRKGVSFCGYADSLAVTAGPGESGIPSLACTAVAVDFTGTVWVGTESGVGTLSLADSSWKSLADMDVLAHRYVTSIAVMNDFSIWFGTRGGASVRASAGQWTSYIGELGSSFEITDIAAGPGGSDVWLGSTNGIAVHSAGGWTFIDDARLPSTRVNALYRDATGVVWCGTSTIAASFDGNAWVRHGASDGLDAAGINDFAQDMSGRLWAATDTGLFYRDGGSWSRLDLPQTVEGAIIYALACDHVNALLWLATSRGAMRYALP